MNLNKNLLLKIFIVVAVFLAVLSQEPNYKNILPMDQLCNIAWLFVVVYMCLVPLGMRLNVNSTMKLFVMQICIYLLMTVLKAIVYKTELIIGITDFLPIPLMIYCVAYNYIMLQNDEVENALQIIAWTYSIASVILSVLCILNSNMGLSDWMDARIYVYGVGKNAIGQVLGVGIFISFFYLNGDSIVKKIIKYASTIIMIVGLLFVQCRTVILGVTVILTIWFFAFYKPRKSYKIWTVLIVGIIAIILFNNNHFMDIVEKALFLNKYEGQGINSYSSGRINQWGNGIKAFIADPLFGTSYYVDNFYINSLANNGVIVFIMRIILFWSIAIKNIKCTTRNVNFKRLIVSVTILELFVSVLEAFPPYGPGVATMMFWFLSGVAYYVSCCGGGGKIE